MLTDTIKYSLTAYTCSFPLLMQHIDAN